jgi:DNA repair exonuclease SbcCD ATPase subunit
MYIKFKKLSLANIGGYGPETQSIEFEKGISLVVGKNGAGKTTQTQALTYALYGKPFSKVKLSSLPNKYNKKPMIVELDLEINEDRIKIIRGMRPNKFEIYKNEKLLPFSTVKDYQNMLTYDILRMSENIFKQLVALGANAENAKHFMELNQKEKEEILQIITDTKIFSVLVEEIRDQKNILKNKLNTKDVEVRMLRENLAKTELLLQDMKKQNNMVRDEKEQKKKELQGDIKNTQEEINEFEEYEKKFLKVQEVMQPLIHQLNEKDEEKRSYLIKIQTLERELYEFENSGSVTCPKCGSSFKEIQLKKNIETEEIKESIKNYQNNLKVLEEEILKISEKVNKFHEKQREYSAKKQDTERKKYQLQSLNNDLKNLEEQKEISTEATEKQIKELKQKVKKESKLEQQYRADITDYEMLEDILSIKNITGKIISTQIPLLNKFINEYLERFEVDYQFFLSDTLKETIVRRDEVFEYYSLSNGEKQRIILSILFSFLKLIEMSVKINILFLDEFLDSSLDEAGTNLVLEILEEDFQDKNIFIISHKQEIKTIDDKTNSVYYITKGENNKYSKIIKKD